MPERGGREALVRIVARGGLTWARYRMAPDTFKRMTTLQFRDLLLSGNCASTTLHLW